MVLHGSLVKTLSATAVSIIAAKSLWGRANSLHSTCTAALMHSGCFAFNCGFITDCFLSPGTELSQGATVRSLCVDELISECQIWVHLWLWGSLTQAGSLVDLWSCEKRRWQLPELWFHHLRVTVVRKESTCKDELYIYVQNPPET